MFLSNRIVLFTTLAFMFSWGYWGALIGMGLRVTPGSNVSHLPGLFGPALAAIITIAVFDGTKALRDLMARSVRIPQNWGLAGLLILAPILIAASWFVLQEVLGTPYPPVADFWTYPGVPPGFGTWGFVLFVILMNGYGEEIGWRGFLLHSLHPHYGKLHATLMVAAIWLIWHLPLFILNQSMTDLIGPTVIGWIIGLVLGAFVLSWIYLSFENSILVVAVWHIAYNLSVATPATSGIPAAIVSTAVMMMGIWVIWRWWRD